MYSATDAKPRAEISLLNLWRGAKEENEVKASEKTKLVLCLSEP